MCFPEDTVDFTAVSGEARKLSLQAAHDKRNVAKNIKRRRATTKRSLFLHQNEQAKYGTDLVDPSMINVSNIIILFEVIKSLTAFSKVTESAKVSNKDMTFSIHRLFMLSCSTFQMHIASEPNFIFLTFSST